MSSEDYIAVKKMSGKYWIIITKSGNVLQDKLHFVSFIAAYRFITNYVTSFKNVRAKVLDLDGKEWKPTAREED